MSLQPPRIPSSYPIHRSPRSKSTSVLPIHHPELDSALRSTGIRLFSHVPSVRRTEPESRKTSSSNNTSNPVSKNSKVKGRSVSAFTGAMKLKELVGRSGQRSRHAKHAKHLSQFANGRMDTEAMRAWYNEQDRQMVGMPNGQGRSRNPSQGHILPSQQYPPHQGHQLQFPYPQNLPPAASPSLYQPPTMQSGLLSPPPSPQPSEVNRKPEVVRSRIPSSVTLPLDRILYVAGGMVLAIVSLFAWIFKEELIRYGTVVAILVVAWKLAQWHTNIALQSQEKAFAQQGRLVPSPSPSPQQFSPQQFQPQHFPPQPLYPHQSPQMTPGGYIL